MARKSSILVTVAYGVGQIVFPVGMSELYDVTGYRTTMDIVGFCLLGNAIGFLIHSAYNNWGKEREEEKEEEYQACLLESEMDQRRGRNQENSNV